MTGRLKTLKKRSTKSTMMISYDGLSQFLARQVMDGKKPDQNTLQIPANFRVSFCYHHMQERARKCLSQLCKENIRHMYESGDSEKHCPVVEASSLLGPGFSPASLRQRFLQLPAAILRFVQLWSVDTASVSDVIKHDAFNNVLDLNIFGIQSLDMMCQDHHQPHCRVKPVTTDMEEVRNKKISWLTAIGMDATWLRLSILLGKLQRESRGFGPHAAARGLSIVHKHMSISRYRR
ncbi:hypothetical protein V8F33_012216 [Rhypophila sp. PSN 637]